ncbi:hypothetical protein H7X65_03480 [Candidatus Parcubacteria bacterium]|nr:hypothetical protein [Candidatus Parcubacteria bacterium]
MKAKVTIHDRMQKKYQYELSEPVGKNFDIEFKPQLTPKQMLSLGIFGGIYMRDCTKEFPQDWFTKAKFATGNTQDPKLNYFKIKASQSLQIWREKGWIYKDDPRGWFQWYCRYYMGRRIEKEDQRQIKRWKMMRRHIAQIRNNCEPGNTNCRPKQRQALLHWAYDTRS